MNPKEFPQYPRINYRSMLHTVSGVGSSVLGTWCGGLIVNQISNTCLEVAPPCYNVQKSLMSRLHPLSRDTPKAPRYPRRSISTPQWGIRWHPGTWTRRFFADYFMHACERRHDAIFGVNQTALQCNKETTYKLLHSQSPLRPVLATQRPSQTSIIPFGLRPEIQYPKAHEAFYSCQSSWLQLWDFQGVLGVSSSQVLGLLWFLAPILVG